MAIETLDDIVDEVMNRLGIYGAHDDDSDPQKECHCRCCESSNLMGRIRAAVVVEQKLSQQMLRDPNETGPKKGT